MKENVNSDKEETIQPSPVKILVFNFFKRTSVLLYKDIDYF